MDFVALFPPHVQPNVTDALLAEGFRPVPVTSASDVIDSQPGDGWALLFLDIREDALKALELGEEVSRLAGVPVFALARPEQLEKLAEAHFLADFIAADLPNPELGVRLDRVRGTDMSGSTETVSHRDLSLNLATYQATIDSEPVDLTFMEYELLRFFVTNPGRVWSREQILSKVWGYDYYGGSRTVDVHVRRLRVKLGEERASWISTVRSVGYRFS